LQAAKKRVIRDERLSREISEITKEEAIVKGKELMRMSWKDYLPRESAF
jgi:hypothetical protein